MEYMKVVVGMVITIGPILSLVILLNWRDRRTLRLRHTVFDQLAQPELRGHVGVRIQCAVFSWRSTVIIDLLAGTTHEVWHVFTHVASCLPPRVRLVVHGAVGSGFMRSCTLETITRRLPPHKPPTSFVTG